MCIGLLTQKMLSTARSNKSADVGRLELERLRRLLLAILERTCIVARVLGKARRGLRLCQPDRFSVII